MSLQNTPWEENPTSFVGQKLGFPPQKHNEKTKTVEFWEKVCAGRCSWAWWPGVPLRGTGRQGWDTHLQKTPAWTGDRHSPSNWGREWTGGGLPAAWPPFFKRRSSSLESCWAAPAGPALSSRAPRGPPLGTCTVVTETSPHVPGSSEPAGPPGDWSGAVAKSTEAAARHPDPAQAVSMLIPALHLAVHCFQKVLQRWLPGNPGGHAPRKRVCCPCPCGHSAPTGT